MHFWPWKLFRKNCNELVQNEGGSWGQKPFAITAKLQHLVMKASLSLRLNQNYLLGAFWSKYRIISIHIWSVLEWYCRPVTRDGGATSTSLKLNLSSCRRKLPCSMLAEERRSKLAQSAPPPPPPPPGGKQPKIVKTSRGVWNTDDDIFSEKRHGLVKAEHIHRYIWYFSWLNTKTVWWKDTLCSWPVQCELWIHLKNVPRSISWITIWVFFGMIEFVLLHLARSSKFILKSGTHWHENTLIGSEEGGPIWLKSSQSWDVHITSTVTNPLYFKLMGQ